MIIYQEFFQIFLTILRDLLKFILNGFKPGDWSAYLNRSNWTLSQCGLHRGLHIFIFFKLFIIRTDEQFDLENNEYPITHTFIKGEDESHVHIQYKKTCSCTFTS